jgi:cobalt/nickel transport system ATP-binding protein
MPIAETRQPVIQSVLMPSEAAISVVDLSFSYPDQPHVLQQIYFQIQPRERVAIIGENGCGKTTLFSLLCGVLSPTYGTIACFGQPVLPGRFDATIGLVFQNPDDQLFSTSVWEDVAFGLQNLGLPPALVAQRVTQALELTEVLSLAQRPPHHLSGGQKKRVAIAAILAMQPQILLLDEPTAQLDPRSRRQLIYLLGSLPQTQLIATHDLDLALELCERAIVLSRGQIVYDGATAQVLSDGAFLEQHALELPLSYSRPYCLLQDQPIF